MAQHPYRRAMARGRLNAASEAREHAAIDMHQALERYHHLRREYVEAAIAEQHAEVALRHATLGIDCGPDCWACGSTDTEIEDEQHGEA